MDHNHYILNYFTLNQCQKMFLHKLPNHENLTNYHVLQVYFFVINIDNYIFNSDEIKFSLDV